MERFALGYQDVAYLYMWRMIGLRAGKSIRWAYWRVDAIKHPLK
jgi:hypothetical protein